VASIVINPKWGMENVYGAVGIQSWIDFRYPAHIFVDETAQSLIVFNSAHARASSHEQLEIRNAKSVLTGDQ
jgi:hypothetical protein